MCGIAGLFDLRGHRPVDSALLQRMGRSLAHRGPDGEGFLSLPGCGLAHRRLAIIDVAGGAQPLGNEDGSVLVVFNGEIYNHSDLREELARRGHRFATASDTEVIVHAWEEWQEDCVSRLTGMFAFALYDRNRDAIFLARDRLGIKPLYYAALPSGWLAFGSELKALLVDPDLPRRLDPSAVEDFLAHGYVPEPRTIYADAAKLPPAHTLLVRRGAPLPAARRYWALAAPRGHVTEAEAVATLHDRLTEIVREHLMSEVPLGAFLSGGVDSSAVVATMSGLIPEPVNTYAIGFADPAFDETRHAETVARLHGARHHRREADMEADSHHLIDRLATIYDEPFADSSALPTWQVCALAREGVHVALSGDGGDEIFGGYIRYRWHADEIRLRRWIPGAGLRLMGLAAGALPERAGWPLLARLRATLAALGRDPVTSYDRIMSMIPEEERARLYTDGFRRRLGGYRAIETLRRRHAEAPAEDPVGRMQYVDLMTFLPGDILTKVDRASMAHGLEVRVPLLDHRLVEWAFALPPHLRLRQSEGKYLLKKAFENRLPRDVLYRRKMGFSVPLDAWFRGPLAERARQALLGPRLAETGLFEPAALQSLLERHASGRANLGTALWSLLMFEAFLRLVHDRSVPTASVAA